MLAFWTCFLCKAKLDNIFYPFSVRLSRLKMDRVCKMTYHLDTKHFLRFKRFGGQTSSNVHCACSGTLTGHTALTNDPTTQQLNAPIVEESVVRCA